MTKTQALLLLLLVGSTRVLATTAARDGAALVGEKGDAGIAGVTGELGATGALPTPPLTIGSLTVRNTAAKAIEMTSGTLDLSAGQLKLAPVVIVTYGRTDAPSVMHAECPAGRHAVAGACRSSTGIVSSCLTHSTGSNYACSNSGESASVNTGWSCSFAFTDDARLAQVVCL